MATTKTELLINGSVVETKTTAPFLPFNYDTTGLSGNVTVAVREYIDGSLAGTTPIVNGSVTAAGDTTAPTSQSASIEDANPDQLVWNLNEDVNATGVTGLSITGDETPTITSIISGSGTSTLLLQLSASVSSGSSLTLNVASTNDIADIAGNGLPSTTQSIMNNVTAPAGVDPDYQAVLDYWTANSIPLPDSAQQAEDNQVMIDAKSSGVWAKSDAMGYIAGNASKVAAARLTDWKRLIQMPVEGTVTYGSFGAKGDGSTGRIKTGFIPATHGVNYTLNNSGVMILTRELATNNQGSHFGVIQSGKVTQFTENWGDTTSYVNVNGQGSDQISAGGRYLGLNGLYRNSATNIILYRETAENYTLNSSTSGTLATIEMYLLGRNSDGSLTLPTNGSIAFFAIGADMSAEHPALKTALE